MRGAGGHLSCMCVQILRENHINNRRHTSSGGANAEVVGVRDLVNVDVK